MGAAVTDPRARVVAKARAWIGTPYQHQAARRGVGCDCLGLVRGVYADLYGIKPSVTIDYTSDWAEASGRETLRDAARDYLDEVPIDDAAPGDVVLFRIRPAGPAKHCGILVEGTAARGRMIHAYSGRHVTESSVLPRAVFAFRFRDV